MNEKDLTINDLLDSLLGGFLDGLNRAEDAYEDNLDSEPQSDDRHAVYVNDEELTIVGEALNLYAAVLDTLPTNNRAVEDVEELADAVIIELGR